MNFINIQVPESDFLFENIAKKRASKIINEKFYIGSFDSPYTGMIGLIQEDINREILTLIQLGDKIIFIVELITKTVSLKKEHTENILKLENEFPRNKRIKQDGETTIDNLNEMQYFFYGLLSKCGYNLDSNTFSEDEGSTLDGKIDEILEIIKIVKMGQEALGEEVEVLKFDILNNLREDFESIKNEKPLGKKVTLQRISGVVFEYVGTKLADEVYDGLKTAMIALLVQHGIQITDVMAKLLGH